MSDKKNDPQKPRFVPIVEDVEDVDLPDVPKKPQKPGDSGNSGNSGEPGAPAPERAAEKSPEPAKPADEGIKTVPNAPDPPSEPAKPADLPGGTGESGQEITGSGMVRRDEEIDRSIFAAGEGVDPEAIGFSPETDVSELAKLKDEGENPLSFGDLTGQEPDSDEEQVVRKVKVRQRMERGASLRTLVLGVCYLAVVIVTGILLGSKIVSVGNDIFAFTFETDLEGNPVNYTIVIDDAGMSPAEVGKMLKDAGVIKYDWAFKLYAQLKKKENFKVTPGSYTLSADANYDSIMSQLNPVPARQEITITFTEGMNTDEIIELFLENGIGTREGFEQAINSYPYSYWFMDYLRGDLPDGRFYRLDGYLYPDTYRFYSDTGEVAAIDKLLANFDKKFGEEYKEACDDLGLTPDEVVRIASMIEAEVKHAVDIIPVASVFHNRLKSSSFDGLIQSDATVQYYFYHTEGARHEEITPEDLETDTPYNTYLYKGLPPGAICNPSLTSLRAALYPDDSCPYYYFVARPNGYMYYAKTLAEHNANIEKVREESENTGGGVGEHE